MQAGEPVHNKVHVLLCTKVNIEKKIQIPLKFIRAVTSNQKLSPEKGWIFRKFSSQNIDTHNGK